MRALAPLPGAPCSSSRRKARGGAGDRCSLRQPTSFETLHEMVPMKLVSRTAFALITTLLLACGGTDSSPADDDDSDGAGASGASGPSGGPGGSGLGTAASSVREYSCSGCW